jgi:hypothetical protein
VRSTVEPDHRTLALSRWPRLLLAILVGAGLVTACSGGGTAAPGGGEPEATSPAQSAAPAVDVCALLPVADVTAITGKETTPEAAAPAEDWSAGECWWDDAKLSVRFGVTVGTAASIAKSTSPTAKEQYDLSKLAFGGDNPDLVSGLGEEAFFGGGFVFTYQGGTFAQALGIGVDRDQLVEILKLVLARL